MTTVAREDMPVDERRVCDECIGERYVSQLITSTGTTAVCDYCLAEAPTLSVGELGSCVEHAIGQHFVLTAREPEGFDYYVQRETGVWDRRGDSVADVIARILEADEQVADEIRECLDDRTSDWDSVAIGEEQPFETDAYYEEASRVDHSKLSEQYRHFERLVTEEARYFSPESRLILGSLFERLDNHRTQDGRSIVVQAGPSLPRAGFFRARVFQDDEPLKLALAHPDVQLGPPPPRAGRAGRLNAAGVSIFYGADLEEAALAEVRPPVGSRVVTARFELLRPVRLLDIEALQSVLVEGSYFDPEHLGRLQHAAFLRSFSARFTRPVLPDHEAFEYVTTQAIADFLAHETDPLLDGILYSSAQSGLQGANVALFHKASRVEQLQVPAGATHDVHFGWETEDDFEQEYRVFEEVPTVEPATAEQSRRTEPHDLFLDWPPAPSDPDSRPITLRVIVDSVTVHHIDAVQIRSNPHHVTRSRDVKRTPDF
jgi:hypothetical protein